jgi:hypothetical protein
MAVTDVAIIAHVRKPQEHNGVITARRTDTGDPRLWTGTTMPLQPSVGVGH